MNIDDFFEKDQCKRFLEDIQGYYVDSGEKEESKPLSTRIKELRQIQGFSLQHLAKISGLDPEIVLKIEKQEIFPDLGTVVKLSKALRITTGLLLGEESGYSYSVVKKGDRKKIKRFVSGTKKQTNYEYRSLASGIQDKHMESFIVTLKEKKKTSELSCHDGEEFIMVLKGSIKVALAAKEEVLEEGDTIYYLSSIPHNLTPITPEAEILAVMYASST